MCWKQGRERGEQMVLYVQGRGRSWGPDPRLVPSGERAVVRRKKGGIWEIGNVKVGGGT